MENPQVGIVMGSDSDWPLVKKACETLDKFGVAYETRVISAHRTPEAAIEYSKTAEARGLKVVIAAAGGAAHLAGDAAKYETAMQIAAMEARLTSKMDANEITALRDKVQALELKNAVSGVLRYPDSWTYNAGVFPPLTGAA